MYGQCAATIAAASKADLLADLRQVGNEGFIVFSENLGACRHLQNHVRAGGTGPVFAHAVQTGLGLEVFGHLLLLGETRRLFLCGPETDGVRLGCAQGEHCRKRYGQAVTGPVGYELHFLLLYFEDVVVGIAGIRQAAGVILPGGHETAGREMSRAPESEDQEGRRRGCVVSRGQPGTLRPAGNRRRRSSGAAA